MHSLTTHQVFTQLVGQQEGHLACKNLIQLSSWINHPHGFFFEGSGMILFQSG